MSDDIVKSEGQFLAPAVSVRSALEAYQAKKDLIENIMRSGVDFGVIPGTSKPSLLKAGAEKVTSFFGLSTKFFDVESIEDFTGDAHNGEPLFFYRRACELWRGDRFVARAEGSCNSWEKKYRYRMQERTCPSCGNPTIIVGKKEYGGGFVCYAKKGGCGKKFNDNDESITGQKVGQIKNPDVAEAANTILKIADKRALIATTLIATGMSEYFTQDLDDFIDTEIIDAHCDEAKEKNDASMTLEKAASFTMSDGRSYGSLSIDELKKIKDNSKAPDEKRMAARVIIMDKIKKGVE